MTASGLQIYDTTLRDGAQHATLSFSVADKIKIAIRLDELGVSHIEGGWPGANPKDTEFFAEMRSVTLRNAVLTAFGATRRPGIAPSDDEGLRTLLDAQTSVMCLVGKAWDRHVSDVIRTSLDENLRMIGESVAYLVAQGHEVFFDAEHFFDGYESDADYALRTVDAALQAGAARVILCDTNGGTLPDRLESVTRELVTRFGSIGIHCHDDSGVAAANTLAAVRVGVVQVQGCINGYGERTGNANLSTVIPNLQLKMGMPVITPEQLRMLTETSQYVAEIANLALDQAAPYVGQASFTHKGGQHIDAMIKASYAYQHIEPALVGNEHRLVISDQSGKSTVVAKGGDGGIDLSGDPELARRIALQVKELEHRGFSYEGAEASFELLIHRARGHQPSFELIDFITLAEKRSGQTMVSEATVKIRMGGEVVHTASDGNGPVNAIDMALRKALLPTYPAVAGIRLLDYKVRVLDGTDGTGASVRVLIESGDGVTSWSTVGCSSNIIDASWLALADAIEYGLLRARTPPPAEDVAPSEESLLTMVAELPLETL